MYLQCVTDNETSTKSMRSKELKKISSSPLHFTFKEKETKGIKTLEVPKRVYLRMLAC